MKEEQLYALIEQELRGTLNESDAGMLADWVGQGREEETTYQEVRSILEITAEGISVMDPQTDTSWDALQSLIGEAEVSTVGDAEITSVGNTETSAVGNTETENTSFEGAPVIPMRRSRTRIYGIAATVVLLVVAALFIVLPGDTPGVDKGKIFASTHSEVKQLDLPDGSHVTLNSESKLEMPADFNDEVRRVKLEGEAFFDIARNEEKPFIIEVMGTETRVLGTSFTISAYPATQQVMVSVVTGHVEFSPIGSDAKIDLTPNQAGRFDLKTNKLSRMETAASDDAAWQDGKYVFRKVPFGIALERLEKHYDLEFVVSPDLENEPLTTTIDVNTTSEEDLLSLLQVTFQVQIERNGKRVEIKK